MIWLLLACSRPPEGPWTREAALTPALARVDADHDGKVSAAEYHAVAFRGPSFTQADADGDGFLDVGELDWLTTMVDPTTFYVPPRPAGAGKFGNGGPKDTKKRSKHGDVWIVLNVLREEVLARDPAAVVPTDEEIVAADVAGGFDAPATRAVLAKLRAESERVGVGFPASLR